MLYYNLKKKMENKNSENQNNPEVNPKKSNAIFIVFLVGLIVLVILLGIIL
jgi:uncharacterized integral membrane protein